MQSATKTVLCYGDSNTYGYDPEDSGRYGREFRWTTLLGQMLGDGCEVIAEGLNGRTTAYDRPDRAWMNGYLTLMPAVGTHKPVNVLILMLGTNDCNRDLYLSAETIAAGMEKLVHTVQEETPERQGFVPRIVVVAPAAILPEIAGTPFEYQLDQSSVEKSHALAPLYEAIARRNGCAFVDATECVEVSPRDCEHLTQKGHEQLAKLLYPVVRDLLRQ